MNTIDYKQKYLKYKNKYLELKAIEKSAKLDSQTGGFAYAPGEYVFFIPANKANFDSLQIINDMPKQFVDSKGTILGNKGLDDLTNYLGNCTKFLRVGQTTSGWDFANTYNTLYPNQSTGSVIKREVDGAKVVVEKTLEVAKQGATQIQQKVGEVSQQIKNVTTQNKLGGNNECVSIPKKLSTDLLIKSQNDININKLKKIVKFIEQNELQGTNSENKITRIIYVKKPIVP